MVVTLREFYGASVELAISSDQALNPRRAFLWVLTPSGPGLAAVLPDARTLGTYFGRAILCVLNLGTDDLDIVDNLSGSTLETLAQNEISFCFLQDASDQDGTWSFRTTTSGAAPSAGPSEVLYTLCGSTSATRNQRYNHQLDTWSTRAACTASHVTGSAFGLGTSLVVFGHNAAPRDTSTQYVPASDSWTTLAAFPESINDHHSQAVSGKGYSLGSGFNPSTNGKDTYESDASIATWTAKTAKPNFARLGSSEVLSGSIYVASGRDNTAALIRDFESYATSIDTWTIRVDYPAPAAQDSSMFATGGNIYKIGGDLGATSVGNVIDDVYEYVPATGLWGVKTLFPVDRTFAAGRAPEGQGVVAGGTAPGSAIQSNGWKYNQSLDSWTAISSMPNAQTILHESCATATL